MVGNKVNVTTRAIFTQTFLPFYGTKKYRIFFGCFLVVVVLLSRKERHDAFTTTPVCFSWEESVKYCHLYVVSCGRNLYGERITVRAYVLDANRAIHSAG